MNAGMDVLSPIAGAAMALAVRARSGFLEAGTVRWKNQFMTVMMGSRLSGQHEDRGIGPARCRIVAYSGEGTH